MNCESSDEKMCEFCEEIHRKIILLDCKHEVCRSCLKKYWKKRVKSSKILCCPLEKCKKTVGNHIFEATLSKKYLEQIKTIQCDRCEIPVIPLKLSCGHNFCAKCARHKAKKSLKNDELPCCFDDSCKKTMKKEDLLNLGLPNKYIAKFEGFLGVLPVNTKNFNTEEENEKKHDNLDDLNEKSLINEKNNLLFCEICSNYYDAEQCKTLTCNHFFCKTCLHNFCKNHIFSKENILCPKQSCSEEINYCLMKEILTFEEFNKYDEFITFKDLKTEKNEKKVECPNCKIAFFVWEQADFFKCAKCAEQFCVKCLANWNSHENKVCSFDVGKNLKEKDQKNLELTMEKLNNDKIFKKCPVCKILIEKVGTCNSMQCSSEICQKKTIFCFLCGEILNKTNFSTHYIENNHYETCVNSINKANTFAEKRKNSENSYKNKNKSKGNTAYGLHYSLNEFQNKNEKKLLKKNKYCQHEKNRMKANGKIKYCPLCDAFICSKCNLNLENSINFDDHQCKNGDFIFFNLFGCSKRNKT